MQKCYKVPPWHDWSLNPMLERYTNSNILYIISLLRKRIEQTKGFFKPSPNAHLDQIAANPPISRHRLFSTVTHLQDLQDRRKEGGKKTLNIILFIPALFFPPYLLLSRHSASLSFPLLSSLCGFSLTSRLWDGAGGEPRDLETHLQSIRAWLQPPMDSVTDGAGVFIAEVIGNTHIHAQTHVCSASAFLKQIEPFPIYNSYSICGFALPSALRQL